MPKLLGNLTQSLAQNGASLAQNGASLAQNGAFVGLCGPKLGKFTQKVLLLFVKKNSNFM
jgi:hypothetical protein